MIDYFKQCTVYEDPLVPPENGKEFEYCENLYRKQFGDTNSCTNSRNDDMRCLSWSYCFIQWQSLKENNHQRRHF